VDNAQRLVVGRCYPLARRKAGASPNNRYELGSKWWCARSAEQREADLPGKTGEGGDLNPNNRKQQIGG
jgi:hypothetical protein